MLAHAKLVHHPFGQRLLRTSLPKTAQAKSLKNACQQIIITSRPAVSAAMDQPQSAGWQPQARPERSRRAQLGDGSKNMTE